MAVKVRQTALIQQPMPHEPQQQPSHKPKKIRKKSFGISGREKFLILILTLAVISLAIMSLQVQSEINLVNMEIDTLEEQVVAVSNENVGLKVQVGELSTYERIWQKAQELGLTLNEKNVKVVPNE
mgnify:FL=1